MTYADASCAMEIGADHRGRVVNGDEFDISVVLNVHAETRYLRRTTRSLEACARFARGHGLKVELVLLGDSSPSHTRQWISRYESDSFDSVTKDFTEVDSLGLARNRGAELARGKYIRFCDGDDLFSLNSLKVAFETAEKATDRVIVYPEYLCSFGDAFVIYKLYPLSEISPLGFIGYHPYISNIFCSRRHILDIRYRDEGLGKTIAYEDWHFVTEALARGFSMITAPNTAIYYRRRVSSLLMRTNASSMRVTDNSTLFAPSTYLRVCGDDRALNEDLKFLSPQELREEYATNRVAQELALAANSIEPALDLATLDGAHAFSNKEGDLEPGRVYYQICKLVEGWRFDQVVLLPFLTRGGGEKFVLSVLRALLELDPAQSVLILCGEKFDKPHWLDMVPENAVLVDLAALGERLNEEQRHLLCLRTIQNAAPTAMIHVKACPSAQGFIGRYGELLQKNRLVFYRFSDARVVWHGEWMTRGSDFDFISNFGQLFEFIVTDHVARAQYDSDRMDELAGRYRVIPNFVDIGADPAPPDRRFKRKILWASRLEFEKRPELLALIAAELEHRLPGVQIDAFGSDTVGRFDLDAWKGRSNLTYRGPFSGFASLPFREYDAFLYTTAFDGLPNIVLEAMAAGLTPIAPDVGGLSEVVTPETGFLLPNISDAAALARSYADAIESLYASPAATRRLREDAVRLMRECRAWPKFVANVAEAFALTPASQSAAAVKERA